jgi:hypothetical protein
MRKTITTSIIAPTVGAGVLNAADQTGVVDAAKHSGKVTKDTAKAVR